MGLSFRLVSQDVCEKRLQDESPADYVTRLALSKARAGLAQLDGENHIIVLGSDTCVEHKGEALGKPENEKAAAAMLEQLSGQWHEVYTAVSVVGRDEVRQALSASRVKFRTLGKEEIAAYCASGEPMDKAGSYAIQGRGAIFVEFIEGSYSGIVGLPVLETISLLSHWGYTPAAVLAGVTHER